VCGDNKTGTGKTLLFKRRMIYENIFLISQLSKLSCLLLWNCDLFLVTQLRHAPNAFALMIGWLLLQQVLHKKNLHCMSSVLNWKLSFHFRRYAYDEKTAESSQVMKAKKQTANSSAAAR